MDKDISKKVEEFEGVEDPELREKFKKFRYYIDTVLADNYRERAVWNLILFNTDESDHKELYNFFDFVKNFERKNIKLHSLPDSTEDDHLDSLVEEFFYRLHNEYSFDFLYAVFKAIANQEHPYDTNIKISGSSEIIESKFSSMLVEFERKLEDEYTEKYDRYRDAREEKQRDENLKLINEIEEIRDKVKEMLPSSGAAAYSEDYLKIADAEDNAKKMWLYTIGVCVVAALVFALCTICTLADNTTPMAYLARLPMVAVLAFATLWAVHQYSVARRNHLIYRHLATTLSTYNAFDKSINEENRGLLLFEMAKVLFAPPADKKTENQRELANMIDLVKVVSSKNLIGDKTP